MWFCSNIKKINIFYLFLFFFVITWFHSLLCLLLHHSGRCICIVCGQRMTPHTAGKDLPHLWVLHFSSCCVDSMVSAGGCSQSTQRGFMGSVVGKLTIGDTGMLCVSTVFCVSVHQELICKLILAGMIPFCAWCGQNETDKRRTDRITRY